MVSLLHSRITQRTFVPTLISIIVVAAIILANPMTTNSGPIEQLESRISLAELITLVALAFTLVAGAFAFYFKTRLNQLQKVQLEQFQVDISSSNERSSIANAESQKATAIAEEARLKQKRVEQSNLKLKVELERLRLATRDRILPANMLPEIREKLQALRGNRIAVSSDMSDAESVALGRQIVLLFQSAKWVVDEYTAKFHPPIKGLHIVINSDSVANRAELIVPLFEQLGFPLSRKLDRKEEKPLQIFVGRKEIKSD